MTLFGVYKKLFSISMILSVTALMGCQKLNDALDKTEKMGEKMDRSTEQVKKTSDATRLLKLKNAKDDMLSEQSSNELTPIPTGVLAGGKTFAESATPTELMELAKTWIARIDKVMPLVKFDENGNEVPLTAEELNKEFRTKYQYLQALRAVAGFIPQNRVATSAEEQKKAGNYETTIEDVIREHLNSPYRKTLMKVLMLRVDFIRHVMVENAILSQGVNYSSEAREASKWMDRVDYVLQLPFVSQIGLKTLGITGPGSGAIDLNFNHSLDLTNSDPAQQSAAVETIKSLVEPWESLVLAIQTIPKDIRPDSGDPATDQKIREEENKNLSEILGHCQDRMNYWKAKVP